MRHHLPFGNRWHGVSTSPNNRCGIIIAIIVIVIVIIINVTPCRIITATYHGIMGSLVCGAALGAVMHDMILQWGLAAPVGAE